MLLTGTPAKILVAIAMLLSAGIATAQVTKETASIAEALSGHTRGTIVLLDLDNTVLVPRQMLGSDMWFEHFVNASTQARLSTSFAREAARALTIEVMDLAKVDLIEPVTPALIRQLKQKGVPVFGLTARSEVYLSMTNDQLRHLGIDFSQATLPRDTHWVTGRVQLHDGVIYTGGTNKGEALTAFLDLAGYRPDAVVMVDDKEYNLKDVAASMSARGVRSLLYRYSAVDHVVKAFDGKAADVQLDRFIEGRLISDEAAKKAAATHRFSARLPHALLCRQLFAN